MSDIAELSEIADAITSIGIRDGDDLHVGSLKRLGITRGQLTQVARAIGSKVVQVSGLDYYILKGVS
jgi:hypothetical protein